MDALLTTIIKRPYVFAFLIAYLFLSIRAWGWKRSLLWLVSGYGIAWLSEYSSIHNGFPYGEYHYIYENLSGELLVAGVPFFDSLSYPFLIFAGYATAMFVTRHASRVTRHARREACDARRETRDPPIRNPQSAIRNLFFGALFTMLLDVIIDPIATMGDKWFLGNIHYYTYPGFYFGVPMTNFGGWFLVAAVVIAFNVTVWRFLEAGSRKQEAGRFLSCFMPPASCLTHRFSDLIYPLFYTAIAIFNIVITFWVGEWKLGIASTVILSTIFCYSLLSNRR